MRLPARGRVVLALLAAAFASPLPISGGAQTARVHVERLRTNDAETPIGIGYDGSAIQLAVAERRPRSPADGIPDPRRRGAGDLQRGRPLVWDSGRVESDDSTHRPYGRASACVGTIVRVGGSGLGRQRPPLDTQSARALRKQACLQRQTGLPHGSSPGSPRSRSAPSPSPFLRRAFTLSKAGTVGASVREQPRVVRAVPERRRVGDQVLTPGWTSYKTRIQYQTYDVTPLLKRGANVVGAILGEGWYRGNIGFSGQRNLYGDRLALIAQIVVTFAMARAKPSPPTDGGKRPPVQS
jgi:alpha-L-rhamnosidase